MGEGDSETFSVMRVDDARNQLSRVNYICDPVRIYVLVGVQLVYPDSELLLLFHNKLFDQVNFLVTIKL